MTQLKTRFAKRLKQLREEKELTQEELAGAIGRSASFVSNLERGIDAPSFDTLESIAKALKVKVRDLFDF